MKLLLRGESFVLSTIYSVLFCTVLITPIVKLTTLYSFKEIANKDAFRKKFSTHAKEKDYYSYRSNFTSNKNVTFAIRADCSF